MKISSSKASFIELLGTYGKFNVLNSHYTIHYFSTYANNRDNANRDLLKELKPMRERMAVENLDDLSALLQRDLNDLRVANDLVPYLENKQKDLKHIAFFPAVLAVLAPADFIQNNENSYPLMSNSSETENSGSFNYSDYWILERFKDENSKLSPLGKIKINLSKTSVIVLDGQHRANAFRVLANCFNNDANKIYNNFYENIEPIENLDADLPVTLVWFETSSVSDKVEPKMISRKLFVDVNNSAKSVSKSRTILLNDRIPSSILTRFFYSRIAKNSSFKTNELSLLSSGFDVDTDLKLASPHIFTLTTPEIIDYTFDWFYFGSRNFSDLQKYQSREMQRNFIEYFEKYLSKDVKYVEFTKDSDGNSLKKVKSDADLVEFENDFNNSCGLAFESIFNNFNLLKCHYLASDFIEESHIKLKGEWESPSMSDAWEKLYKGGEGLYYVFNNLKKKNSQIMSSAKTISDLFSKHRADLIKADKSKVDEAFRSFRSLAFQVGLFMALDKFYSTLKFNSLTEAADDFINRLNKWSPKDWVYILTNVRETLLNNVDPKSWPAYQNLILRLIQEKNEFYDLNQNVEFSPEAKIFEKYFRWEADSYVKKEYRRELSQTKSSEISQEKFTEFVESAFTSVNELFSPLKNFKTLKFDPYVLANKLLEKFLIPEEDE